MARRFRPRKEFKFWLYHDLAEDVRLIDFIACLVVARQYTKTIRNGLRLMWSLGEGDLSVLFELFPGLRPALQAPPTNGGGDVEKQIEELKEMIQEYQNNAIPLDAPLVALPALKSTNGGGFQLEAADDDQDTIVLKPTASTDAGKNFLGALAGLQ